MAQTNHVVVHVELNGLRHTAEGDSEQVIKEVIQFISRVCPPFDIASRLVWSPDYAKMLETISSLAKVSPSGEIIITELLPSADQAIGLVLLCAHVASTFGKRMNNEMSAEEISSASGKAVKTVRNTLVQMLKAGLVERTGRGTYKITTNGMKEVQEATYELSLNEISRNSSC